MIVNETRFIKNDDKRELFLQKWSKEGSQSDKSFLIVHGLGEHSDAYKEIAKILAEFIDVYAFDFSGHGRSSGQRGYVGDIKWLLDDLGSVVKEINAPDFILAHSLGGLITISALQENLIQTKGLIFSNPCLGLKVNVPAWKRFGADLLTKSLPRITLGNEIKTTDLSNDKEYIEAHTKDPLRHKKVSPRLYLGMLDLIENLDPKRFPQLKTLVLLSESDPICNPHKAEAYFSGLENKEVHFFSDSMHEILNDLEKRTAHKLIKDFIC